LIGLTPQPLPAALPPRSGQLPRQAGFRLRSNSVSGFPLLCLNIRMPYLCLREPMGPPKFSMLLFLHARRSDPDRPSGISPCLYFRSMFVFSVLCLVSRQCHFISTMVLTNDSSVLASRTLTLSPSAFLPLTRLISLQGGANAPLAYKILCVRFTPVVHVGYSLPTICYAVRQRRNTRYGWVVNPYERSS
jgi:hypothetical protein